MDEHLVTLHMLDKSPAPDVLEDMAEALGDARVGTPDEAGMVEVEVRAPDREDALRRVRDAIAAAGAEEHFTFPETTGTGFEPPESRAEAPE